MFLRRKLPQFFFGILIVTAVQAMAKAEDVIDIGSRRELFVDRFLIDRTAGVALVLERPRDEGIVLRFDKPWEGAFCGYATVIQDGPLFRLYYRGLPRSGQDGSDAEVTCYAESKDGIVWSKPELGLVRDRREQGQQRRAGRHAAVLAQLQPDDRHASRRRPGRAVQGAGGYRRERAASPSSPETGSAGGSCATSRC